MPIRLDQLILTGVLIHIPPGRGITSLDRTTHGSRVPNADGSTDISVRNGYTRRLLLTDPGGKTYPLDVDDYRPKPSKGLGPNAFIREGSSFGHIRVSPDDPGPKSLQHDSGVTVKYIPLP